MKKLSEEMREAARNASALFASYKTQIESNNNLSEAYQSLGALMQLHIDGLKNIAETAEKNNISYIAKIKAYMGYHLKHLYEILDFLADKIENAPDHIKISTLHVLSTSSIDLGNRAIQKMQPKLESILSDVKDQVDWIDFAKFQTALSFADPVLRGKLAAITTSSSTLSPQAMPI